MKTESKWKAVKWRSVWVRGVPKDRAAAWKHDDHHPTIRHCGHPTASYPYYIDGIDTLRTFRTLAMAKRFIEQGEYMKLLADEQHPGPAPHRYADPARGASAKWVNRHGRTVEVLRSEDEGLDSDNMPWLAVCTEHGTFVSVQTKADGVICCRDTTQFCDECRDEDDRNQAGHKATA